MKPHEQKGVRAMHFSRVVFTTESLNHKSIRVNAPRSSNSTVVACFSKLSGGKKKKQRERQMHETTGVCLGVLGGG